MTRQTAPQDDQTYWRRLQQQVRLQPDEWGFVCAYGLGDAYLISALARRFTNAHGGKVVVIATPPQCEVAGLFCEGVSRAVGIDHINRRAIDRLGARQLGNLFVAHPAHHPSQLYRKLGRGGYHMADLYREYLGLARTAELDKPVFQAQMAEQASSELERLGLPPGRTAVLAPVTRSVPMIQFPWARLVAQLKDRGWAVCTNVAAGEEPVNGTIALRCPLKAVVPLLDQAGWLIAMRNGFCDLAAAASCRMSILYPRFKWYAGSLLDGASIRRMGLNDTAREYEIAPSTDQAQLVDRLVDDQAGS